MKKTTTQIRREDAYLRCPWCAGLHHGGPSVLWALVLNPVLFLFIVIAYLLGVSSGLVGAVFSLGSL